MPGFERLERFGNRRDGLNDRAALLQYGSQKVASVVIVVEDQHAHAVERSGRARARDRTRTGRMGREQRGRLQGKASSEDGARAIVAIARLDDAAVQLHQFPYERQADAKATGRAGWR